MGFTIDGGFLLGVVVGIAGTVLYKRSHHSAHEAYELRAPRTRRRLPRARYA